MSLIFTLIFFVSLFIVIGILYYQWKRAVRGEIEIKNLSITNENELEPSITLRDIGILLLYILKHLIQFLVVEGLKLYYIISKKIKGFTHHSRNPKIAKIINKFKVPQIPPQVKSFVNKTISETKEKIIRVKQDLAHLEETIDKRVD